MAFLDRLLASSDAFQYRYDFGDNWEHQITIESVDDDLENDPMGGALGWPMEQGLAHPKMSAERAVVTIFLKHF